VKGVHSLGGPGCGQEIWKIGTVVREEPGFGAAVCGEWKTRGLDLLVDS
jgi:hypothetical protein